MFFEQIPRNRRHHGCCEPEWAPGPGGGWRAAVATVAEFKPALVILDIMLPDIHGLEVLKRLGAAGHRVPVIFLTAKDATEDKVRGLTVGGDDYVTKPFS